MVRKTELVHPGRLSRRRHMNFPGILPVTKSADTHQLLVRPPLTIPFQKLPEGLLSLSSDDYIHILMPFQSLYSIIGYLRTSKHNLHFWQYLFQILRHIQHVLYVPDIAGKSHHIRLLLKDSLQDLFPPVVDGKLCQFHLCHIFSRIRPQRVHCQIGMDIFCIDGCQ